MMPSSRRMLFSRELSSGIPRKDTMKIRTITFAVGVVALAAALTGCGSIDEFKPAPTRSLALSVVTPQPRATDSRPDSMICKVEADNGSYYVLATSATDHDFTVCLGAKDV